MRRPRAIAALLLLSAAGCTDGGGRGEACADDPFELIEVPASWNATEVIHQCFQWHVIPEAQLPVDCGDTKSVGCIVYGRGWPAAPVAIAAADPIEFGWDSRLGQKREGTMGHECLHGFRGSFHD